MFRKGHRIRLEISSSNFPRFARNLNTGEEPTTDKNLVAATNAVLHDAVHPSALLVPIVPAQ
jgi:predicted acyl esterase